MAPRRKLVSKRKTVSKQKVRKVASGRRASKPAHRPGTLTAETRQRFRIPAQFRAMGIRAQLAPDPERRARILDAITRCFYRLLSPATPAVTEQTGLSDLFKPAWLGQALATALWEWYGKRPWLEAGNLAQALSYGSVAKVGDLLSWIENRAPQ